MDVRGRIRSNREFRRCGQAGEAHQGAGTDTRVERGTGRDRDIGREAAVDCAAKFKNGERRRLDRRELVWIKLLLFAANDAATAAAWVMGVCLRERDGIKILPWIGKRNRSETYGLYARR